MSLLYIAVGESPTSFPPGLCLLPDDDGLSMHEADRWCPTLPFVVLLYVCCVTEVPPHRFCLNFFDSLPRQKRRTFLPRAPIKNVESKKSPDRRVKKVTFLPYKKRFQHPESEK